MATINNTTTVPTHDNNGTPYTISVDDAKEGAQLFDLTPWFKGRVGDNLSPLDIIWHHQGRISDLTNLKPVVSGNVGHYSFEKDSQGVTQMVMASDASTVYQEGNPSDCQAGGRVTYHFPSQIFPKEGAFKGYLGLMDTTTGKLASSIDVWFKVLPGIAQMGIACDYYIDVLDKAITNAQEKLRQHDIDYQAALTKAKKDFEDETQQAITEVKQKYQQIADASEAAATTARASLNKLTATVGDIQAQIDAGNVVTRVAFSQETAKINDSINNRLSKLNNGVKGFANADEIKAKYPDGADGIFVAVDTGHQWYYINGSWQDGGSYQATGIKQDETQITRYTMIYPYGGNGDITFSKTSDGKLIVDLKANNMYLYGAILQDIKNIDILSAVDQAKLDTVKVDGTKIVGTDFVIFYRPATNQVMCRNLGVAFEYGDIILVANLYNNTFYGMLVDYYLDKNFTNPNPPALTDHAIKSSFWYQQTILISENDWRNSQRTITIPATGFYMRYDSKAIEVSQKDLDTFLASQASLNWDPNLRTITTNSDVISWDFTTNSLILTKSSGITKDHAVLLAVDYNHELFGLWIDDMLYRQSTNKYPDVPGYWELHMSKKITQVQQAMAEASANSFAFLWITDTHWEGNTKRSPALIKAMMDNTNIPYMVHGGDLINQGEKGDMIKDSVSSLNAFKQPGRALPVVLGNHDPNSNWADRVANKDKIFTYSEMLNIYTNNQAFSENVELVDFPNSLAWKANYSRGMKHTPQVYGFAFDTYYTSKVTAGQMEAFVDLCKNNGYIMVFMHWFLNNGNWSATGREIGTLIDAINLKQSSVDLPTYGHFDLTGVQAHVIATLSGHEHQDNVRYTTNNTPQIVTTCDAGKYKASNDTFTWTPLTTTEQAFDVFIVDFDRKTIEDIRIGRGQDRSFSFV